jgi:hypothetical protein
MARWLPAAIFMGGLSIFITLRSRAAAMGMVVIILLWFVTLFGREIVLPVEMGGQPFLPMLRPLQPVLWLAHPYLDPAGVTATEYAVNRATLIGLGCALIALSLRRLRDTEWILSGVQTRDDRKQEAQT